MFHHCDTFVSRKLKTILNHVANKKYVDVAYVHMYIRIKFTNGLCKCAIYVLLNIAINLRRFIVSTLVSIFSAYDKG